MRFPSPRPLLFTLLLTIATASAGPFAYASTAQPETTSQGFPPLAAPTPAPTTLQDTRWILLGAALAWATTAGVLAATMIWTRWRDERATDQLQLPTGLDDVISHSTRNKVTGRGRSA